MPDGTPAKKTPRKKAAKASAAGAQPSTPPAATVPPAAPAAGLDEWLHDVARPRTLTVFGRQWSIKAPTGALAVQWDVLNAGRGIGAALAVMMADTERITPDAEAGSARALEFIALAEATVPIDQAQEFWLRIEAVLFPGEAAAS